MSTRIPPSLNWLINKHARLSGKINAAQKAISKKAAIEKKLSKYLAEIARFKEGLPKWQADLAAIDRALGLHDIQVNTEYIQPVAPFKKRIQLPYGELTSSLLMFLRLRHGEPLSTDELTVMLIKRFAHLQDVSQIDPLKLRGSVRYRLKSMARDRIIAKAPDSSRYNPKWIIPTATHHA